MDERLLEVRNLSVAFRFDGCMVPVTSDVSFTITKGEVLGLVGESGSGKSVTAKALMRLLPKPPKTHVEGRISMGDKNLLECSAREIREIRGNHISMIFQEPMTSLNPVFTCGDQIVEAIRMHQHLSKQDALKKATEMLQLVGIPQPETRIHAYPHELSGGMRQRVMIAMALCCQPELLIADEPTTALDPTIQAQILELMKKLQKEMGMSLLYITHDLGVVAEICQRVIVMYAGMIMEVANINDLFDQPLHPYTRGLMKAMPCLDQDKEELYNIRGMVPPITQMPTGCHFHPRCDYSTEECRLHCPELMDVGDGHCVRCFHYQEVVTREVDANGAT